MSPVGDRRGHRCGRRAKLSARLLRAFEWRVKRKARNTKFTVTPSAKPRAGGFTLVGQSCGPDSGRDRGHNTPSDWAGGLKASVNTGQ